MWISFTLVCLLLGQLKAEESQYNRPKNTLQDVRAYIRTIMKPGVDYINTFETPTNMEIDFLFEDLYNGVTLKKVIYFLGKFSHFGVAHAYKYVYPYYNVYSTRIIKSLREFFDSYAGQTNYNPWTHLRAFKQGKSKLMESIILSISIVIFAFLLKKKHYILAILFLNYSLYVFAFKSISTLFYLYVTLFSPVLALVAILKDYTYFAVIGLLVIYLVIVVIRYFTRSKKTNGKFTKFKKSHDAFTHSDVILAKLNDLEIRFNKICERLARLEKEQRKK